MGWDFELGAGTGGFDLELGWDLKMGARSGGHLTRTLTEGIKSGADGGIFLFGRQVGQMKQRKYSATIYK